VEIRHQVTVDRPPSEVFAFLVDTRNFPIVDRALVAVTPQDRLQPGMSGTFVHRRGGIIARTTWQVEGLEEPSFVRVAIRGAGYAMEETAHLAPNGRGTRATFVDTVRPTSIPGRLMVALSGRIMRRDLEQRAALLKAALEGDVTGGGGRLGLTRSRPRATRSPSGTCSR
jgi:hypothetical protein